MWFVAVASAVLDVVWVRSSPREGADLKRREGPRHSLEEMNGQMEVSLQRKQRRSSLRSRITNRRVVECVIKNSDIPL